MILRMFHVCGLHSSFEVMKWVVGWIVFPLCVCGGGGVFRAKGFNAVERASFRDFFSLKIFRANIGKIEWGI